MAAAQAEARRIAAEAEERSKRFAHVQSMFSMKEAAFSGRLAEAQGEAEAARSLSAEARAEASSLKEQLGVMEKEAGELRAGIEALEQANLDMVDQVPPRHRLAIDLPCLGSLSAPYSQRVFITGPSRR